MSQTNDERERARKAQGQLVAAVGDDPDVRLIDIGQVDDEAGGKRLVLRIHVSKSWQQSDPHQRATFPTEIDGVPVQLLLGDYNPEAVEQDEEYPS